MAHHNAKSGCWQCPCAKLAGHVDFRACGQEQETSYATSDSFDGTGEDFIMIECKRRPQDGLFDPTSVTFEDCPEWVMVEEGYILKNMRVMILGIDGYLGWALAMHLGDRGCKISGIDNYARRGWVKERGSHTIVPIARMTDRLHAASEELGINVNFREMDIMDYDALREFVDEVKPEAIVHYAENPSAPYSMIDFNHARDVTVNNTIGSLGLLYIVKELCPETAIIKLGSSGEYDMPLTGRPLFEGIFPADAVLQWQGREWSMGGEITPRGVTSIYHISKVSDTYNTYAACKWWWLRSHDLMQGVVFGNYTPQTTGDSRLATRADTDEWFGTAINKWVAQAVIGHPITLYGSGNQYKGFLSLEDAMQCMTRLIMKPPEPGEYSTVNQISEYYQLKELAQIIKRIGDKFRLDVKIAKVDNPRVESENYPFEMIHERLRKEFGFEPKRSLEETVEGMFKRFMKPEIVARIKEKEHLLMPQTRWDGTKRKSNINGYEE